jgi:hypothetical protein
MKLHLFTENMTLSVETPKQPQTTKIVCQISKCTGRRQQAMPALHFHKSGINKWHMRLKMM